MLVLFAYAATVIFTLLALLRAQGLLFRTLWSASGLAAVNLFVLAPILLLAGKLGFLNPELARMAFAVLSVISLLIVAGDNLNARQRVRPVGIATPAVLLLVVALGMLLGVSREIHVQSALKSAPTFLALAIACTVILSSSLSRSRFIAVSSTAIVALCAGSLAVFALEPGIATNGYSTAGGALEGTGRLSGPLFHPNALGALAAVAAVYALARLKGVTRVLVLVILFAVVLLTDQRGSLVAVVIALPMVLMRGVRPSFAGWTLRTMVVLAILFAVTLVLSGGFLEEFFGRRGESLDERSQIWAFVSDHLGTILPWGIGPAAFQDLTAGALSATGYAHAHNAWLSALVSGGVLAGAGFIALTVLGVGRIWHGRDPYTLGMYLAVVSMSLVESPMIAEANWTLVPGATFAWLALVLPWQGGDSTLPEGPDVALRARGVRNKNNDPSPRMSPIAGAPTGLPN